MYARVVFVFGSERPIAFFYLINCVHRTFHEFREALGVVEVHERESLVGKNDRGAAVDNVMDQHLTFSEAIAKWLNLVGGMQCEVVIRQPDACAFSLSQVRDEVRNVKLRTNIEVRLIKRKIKLEDRASRPRVQIQVMGHHDGFYVSHKKAQKAQTGI